MRARPQLSVGDITTAEGSAHEQLSASIDITEPGFVYIYLSNEESSPVIASDIWAGLLSEYEMEDKNSPQYAWNRKRQVVVSIYRAKNFDETVTDLTRTGMGIHAGRENQDWDTGRKTMGCIRTTPEGFDAIGDAIETYGPLQRSNCDQ